MRDWLVAAACRGKPEIMFDPERTGEALDLCTSCPVKVECVTDAQTWRHEAPACVVGGIAHSTGKRRGRRKMMVRVCGMCGRRMYLKIGSSRAVCDSCRNQSVEDVLEMRRVIQLVLEDTT